MNGWLVCTDCEIRLSFPPGVHVYARGELPEPLLDLRQLDQWIAVPVKPGWCRTCEAPAYIERVPTAQELNAAAQILRNPGGAYHVQDELLSLRLEDIKFLFEGLAHRSTPAKCLICGSTHWVALQIDERGILSPVLRHFDCGGPLKYRGAHIGGYNGTTGLRVYSFSGTLIAEGTTR